MISDMLIKYCISDLKYVQDQDINICGNKIPRNADRVTERKVIHELSAHLKRTVAHWFYRPTRATRVKQDN